MVDGSWMAEFTENEVLANLSEMGYSFDDDIIEATTSICKVGDDIYLAPFFGNVTVMMYNKELIKAAGYEPEDITTFDDLMDIAQKDPRCRKDRLPYPRRQRRQHRFRLYPASARSWRLGR